MKACPHGVTAWAVQSVADYQREHDVLLAGDDGATVSAWCTVCDRQLVLGDAADDLLHVQAEARAADLALNGAWKLARDLSPFGAMARGNRALVNGGELRGFVEYLSKNFGEPMTYPQQAGWLAHHIAFETWGVLDYLPEYSAFEGGDIRNACALVRMWTADDYRRLLREEDQRTDPGLDSP